MRAVLTVEQLWQPVPGGSGTYILELAAALSAAGTDVVGLAAAHRAGPPADLAPAVPVRHVPLPRRVLYDAWNAAHLPRAEHTVRGADVVHATTWAVPPTRRPLVVTVHDVAFRRDPGHFTPRGVRFFERSLARTIDEADVVVVPSEATAGDCVAAGIARERIAVVPHGVRVRPTSPDEIAAFRAAHGLDRPYVLWTGTREPRKNLAGLLAAFALVAADETELDLVLVGPAGWGADVAVPDAVQPRVHALGRLSWTDLHAAYAGARAFCFPSLWEGFGMPVLEAMAHGVPVVTSAGTSMAEAADGAALLAPPTDAASLAQALTRAVGPDHDRLADAGRAVAGRATWAAAAAATAAAYDRAVQARR